MDSALQTSGNMLDRVTVTLTRREVALMNLCLGAVARDHARSGNMRSDIESLQTLLTQVSPNRSKLKRVPKLPSRKK